MNIEAVQRQVDRNVARWVPVTVMWTTGLLWLSNVNWKVPPDFGQTADGCAGLCAFTNAGVDHPVVPGSAWLFEQVVLANFGFFGWLTLVSEVVLAALLLSGRAVRVAAVLGVGQSAAIGLAVANADHEWYWSYLLMIGLHLAVLAFAPVLHPISARVMAAAMVAYGGLVAVSHHDAGFTGDTWSLFTGGRDIPDEFGTNLFNGSIGLGLALMAVGALAWFVAGVADRPRMAFGLALVVVAAGLLLTYRQEGLLIGLGSRAVTAAILAAVGCSLTVSDDLRARGRRVTG